MSDYLLFAIAFRWISKIEYVQHPKSNDDWPYYIMKDFDHQCKTIQLKSNKTKDYSYILYSSKEKYLENAILEPEIPFISLTKQTAKYDNDFDFITFAKFPSCTPKTLDFALELIKDFIK